MYRRLLSNTVASAIAFLSTGFVNLLLVPALVSAYGFAQYGLITLARILLPGGVIGIFDLGYSELATQLVARGREDGNWNRAAGSLRALAWFALSLSVLLALVLGVAAATFVDVFRVQAAEVPTFTWVVVATAAALPLLFAGVLLDGIVKGFEAFHELRRAEIVSSIVYGLAAGACILSGLPYWSVALVYLGSQLLRATQLAFVAWRVSVAARANLHPVGFDDWADLFRRGRVLGGARLLGALQHQSPPLVVGALFGPAAVATYDLVVRLPRFAKIVFALLNSAILPVASRLMFGNQPDQLRALLHKGLIGVSMASVPLSVCGAVFSAEILREWAGKPLEVFGLWQGLMFLVAVLNVFYSFGATALLMRPEVVFRFNVVTIAQIILQYLLAFLLMGMLQERGLILGQVVAVAVSFPIQMAIIMRSTRLPMVALVNAAQPALIACALGGLTWLLGIPARVHGLLELLLVISLWLLVCYGIVLAIGIPRDLRTALIAQAHPARLVALLRNSRPNA